MVGVTVDLSFSVNLLLLRLDPTRVYVCVVKRATFRMRIRLYMSLLF